MKNLNQLFEEILREDTDKTGEELFEFLISKLNKIAVNFFKIFIFGDGPAMKN
jgi:hypothetical protein